MKEQLNDAARIITILSETCLVPGCGDIPSWIKTLELGKKWDLRCDSHVAGTEGYEPHQRGIMAREWLEKTKEMRHGN